MNSIVIIRDKKSHQQTEGQLFVFDKNGNELFRCFTLELPWKENQRQISCIPEGRYKVVPRFSQKYKNHLHILDVPNRTWILIHEANYVHQLLGCIAVGRTRTDLNGDGLKDVTHSVATKGELLKFIAQETELVIKS